MGLHPQRDGRLPVRRHPAGTSSGGPLVTDVRAGTLPNVGLITPDLIHDAHNGTLGRLCSPSQILTNTPPRVPGGRPAAVLA
jgi:hypothetical protein